MRADQIERLKDLQEKIADVFLEEADPDNWSGAGKIPAGMSKEERGGRVFDKKSAINTGSLLARVGGLLVQTPGAEPPKAAEEDADSEIERYEDEAKRILEGMGVRR